MPANNHIAMLEVSVTYMGDPRTVYPTILWDSEHVVLIDTGYLSQQSVLRDVALQAGAPFGQLSHILITHQDLDHIGGLPALLEESGPNIQVLAHEMEKPYIQGDKRILRITDEYLAQVETLPEEKRIPMKRLLENLPKGPVHAAIAGGQELPFCGGLVVVDTSGHTPGHIGFYHKPTKTFIAGDAMVVKNGQLFGPEPAFALDLPTALQSLHTIAQFDIDTIICYHGGAYSDNANARIAELAGNSEKS